MKIELSVNEIEIIMNWAINCEYPDDEDCDLLEKLETFLQENEE